MQLNRLNSYKLILHLFFVLIILNSNAQNDTIPSFYKDSTGRLFIATGTHVFVYIGTTTDPSKSIMLKGDNGYNPIHWSGHGIKRITHLNLFLGRKISFDLFADAIPPKTSVLYDSKNSVQKENTTYLSGQGIIELNAKDPDAGLKDIFYSINDAPPAKYTEPIKLPRQGEYKLSVFSIDNVGNKEEEVTRTIVVDNTPPLTQLDIEGDKFENIISGRSSLALSSVDALGVKQTFYSIDSSKMIPYLKPIKAATLCEGEHTINWYSIDEVENIEPTKSFTLYVDKTSPMVFEEISGNTYMVAGKEFSSGRSQLKIVAVDNKSGVKLINYSLNESPYIAYEKPVYLSDIIGTVSVNSYAVDNVGNRSNSDTQTESFTMPTVDITGPQISYKYIGPITSINDTIWIGPKTKISISAYDIGAGVSKISYKIKGAEDKIYTEPFTVEGMGKQSIVCTAYDNVENINLINFSFGIDNKAPEIFYHYSIEPTSWFSENGESIPILPKGVKIYLAATDNISGVDKLSYSINGKRDILYNSTIEGLKPNGIYTLQVKAVDILGNESEKTIKFKVE